MARHEITVERRDSLPLKVSRLYREGAFPWLEPVHEEWLWKQRQQACEFWI